MITPGIDRHVCPFGHVAIYALRSARLGLMAMMRLAIETPGIVALRTEGITAGDQLPRMDIVAIGAGDASLLHFALQKRPQNENFVISLAIGKIKSLIE